MKIKQQVHFEPVTITFETPEELLALMSIIDEAMGKVNAQHMNDYSRSIAMALANEFTQINYPIK